MPGRKLGAAAVTALALLAAGCGSGSQSPAVASVGTTNTNARSGIAPPPTTADKFAAARCMRTHGVPAFPDPIKFQGKYEFGFTPSSQVDPDSARFKAAYTSCGTKYLGLGHRSTPAQRALWHAEAVKYTACMRSHGVRDFPDPEQANGLIDVPTPNYLDAPKVARGQQACKPLLKSIAFVVPWR